MTARLAFCILAGAMFVAALLGVGEVEPRQLNAVGGLCLIVAITVKERRP